MFYWSNTLIYRTTYDKARKQLEKRFFTNQLEDEKKNKHQSVGGQTKVIIDKRSENSKKSHRRHPLGRKRGTTATRRKMFVSVKKTLNLDEKLAYKLAV